MIRCSVELLIMIVESPLHIIPLILNPILTRAAKHATLKGCSLLQSFIASL